MAQTALYLQLGRCTVATGPTGTTRWLRPSILLLWLTVVLLLWLNVVLLLRRSPVSPSQHPVHTFSFNPQQAVQKEHATKAGLQGLAVGTTIATASSS